MRSIIILLFSLSFYDAWSQHGVSLANPNDSTKIDYQIIPVAWYVPETGFTIGLTGISTFRLSGESKDSRASSILFDAAVTLRGKVFAFIPFEIYQGNEAYRLKGELGMYKYFYRYYGIGSKSRIEDKETYNVVFPRLVANLTRRIKEPFFAGLGYRFDYFDITKIEAGGLLDRLRPTGYDGGIVSSGFLTFLIDSRDHIFDPTKGIYVETLLEKSLTALGAAYDYDKIEVDARYFYSFSNDLTLASNVYYMQMVGNVPFFTMPYLSTSRRGRGFADRRYMDRTLLNVQSEFRFPLFWRFEGAVMASAGFLGNTPKHFSMNDIKWAYGCGLRFLVNPEERNKIRLDLGFTGEDFNFYITANEAF